MNDCRRIVDLFLEVQEGEADVEMESAFHAHLDACPNCEDEFKWYMLGVEALSRLDPIPPPPNFMVELHARLDAAGEPFLTRILRAVGSLSPQAPFPAGMAALGVMAVLAMVLYNGSLTELMATITPGETAKTSAPDSISITKPLRTDAAENAPNPTGTLFKSPEGHVAAAGFTPTIADELGADNVTVESPSVEEAVESLKRILPSLQGRLVDVSPLRQRADGLGRELLVGVRIPQTQYGRLTGELIQHGALEAGAGEKVSAPKMVDPEGPEVLLYIRFLPNN